MPEGGENFDQLAWQALLMRVQTSTCSASLPDVLSVAQSLLARTPVPTPATVMSWQECAVACLVAQRGD